MAKILLLDIETSPKLAYVWSMWKQNIGLNQLVSDWYMLCWCAKWLGDKDSKVMSSALCDYPDRYLTDPEDDSRILDDLHKLLNEADIVIGHNGDRFDIPSINTRFVCNEMLPPDSYQTYDTLKVARSRFKFSSNRLDALGQFLKVGRKIDTGGFQLWRDVLSGDEKAWNKMVKYCKQDVNLLEKVYLKLRAYDPKHPSVAMYTDLEKPVCNVCGSSVQKKGIVYTNTQMYQRYKCCKCGHNMRSRYTMLHADERANVLRSN